MAVTPKTFVREELGNEYGEVVATVPAGKRWVLTSLLLSNSRTGSESASANFLMLEDVFVLHDLKLSPGGVFTLDCAQVLEAGQRIQAWADGGYGASLHACGVEMEA
ncbi:hypothetical protein V1227_18960 [Lentzea sp. DG1S-22]|uniref:hypothetical protein n=1 Tax=Lentzea sp. DG1S-22 TaxID=3108822 RepID=UPI002E77635D|nr:hypothetical protein [Lentzea sp. DG1S-22]WVH84728.1 hypothetical protein V1227_18960 [Lentzea sp. DG1S-22]